MQIDGAIATLTVNEPARANVLTRDNQYELRRLVGEFATNDDVRAIIVTGAGDRVFIGGADIAELRQLTAVTARSFIKTLHLTIEQIRSVEKPVVAAVNGACLGAGLELMLGCDCVVAGETAVFGMPEIEIGIPSVIEAALLVNLLGASRTKEFLMTGDRWDAATALRHGLVNYVVPQPEVRSTAVDLCNRMIRHSPTALALQKDLVNRWVGTDLETGIAYGINALGIAFATGDPQRAMDAFFERRGKAPLV
ncbi:MAG: enoyl-CoA hydratase-related protein [Chloroflexota bacterium]